MALRGPSLSGRRVVVTGGAQGIGRAVVERFAAEGARVTIADLDLDAAGRLADSVAGASAARLDVTDPGAVESLFAAAAEPFDVIIANAGVALPRLPLIDVTDEQWSQVVDVNLRGTFNTIRSGAGRLRRDGRPGRIVVTSSVGGLVPEPGFAAYAATKWAQLGLLKSVALELAPFGILVNGVCPGDVRTSFLGDLADDPTVYSGALGRKAEPDEIAGAYVWLATSDASYMVGETITLDGGLSLSAMAPREPAT